MKTTASLISVALWSTALMCVVTVSCYRSPDPGKLKCTTDKGCPSGYHCTASQGASPGGCDPGPATHDGSSSDLPLLPVVDANLGETGDGAARDLARDLTIDVGTGGAGGATIDARSGGAGGATIDTQAGGVGGTLPLDGPRATGGATSTPDAPGSGGTTSPPPDAPLASDAPDAPPTVLPVGSPCATDGQCSSGSCVDGHCCDSKCTGNCESCATGTCSFTSTPRTPCAGSGKCAGICDKSNTKTCTFDNTTVCAAQSCSGGIRLDKSICDGQGTCPPQSKTTCDGNQCSADGSDCATCTDEPVTTTCAGGHCGPTANNCGHTVQCPTTCPATGQSCGGGSSPGVCGCTPAATTQTCAARCGIVANNCGLSVDCGGCAGFESCGGGGTPGVCGCTPSCAGKCGGTDGCGGTCPDTCVAPQTCGGGGAANVCGCTPNCTGKCGGANGCGGTCPNNCVAPQTCGGGGTANVCGCTPNCTGKCGGTDGCGGTCPNNCVAPQTCGGGGTANVCGCTPNCTGKCGGTDGCGGTCPNNCVAPQTCGGGGTANVCGCTPNSSQCGSRVCGSVSNGCGGTVSCGTCGTGMICSTSGACQCPNGSQPACGSCLNWDFEWGSSPAPWVRELDPNWGTKNGATNMQITQTQKHGGSASLAVPILIDMSTTYTAEVAASTSCLVNLAGFTMTAWVYITGPALTAWSDNLQVDTWSAAGQGDYMVLYWGNIPVGSWFQITAAFTNAASVDRIGIRLTPSTNWQGTMYIDDVVITGL